MYRVSGHCNPPVCGHCHVIFVCIHNTLAIRCGQSVQVFPRISCPPGLKIPACASPYPSLFPSTFRFPLSTPPSPFPLTFPVPPSHLPCSPVPLSPPLFPLPPPPPSSLHLTWRTAVIWQGRVTPGWQVCWWSRCLGQQRASGWLCRCNGRLRIVQGKSHLWYSVTKLCVACVRTRCRRGGPQVLDQTSESLAENGDESASHTIGAKNAFSHGCFWVPSQVPLPHGTAVLRRKEQNWYW